MEQLINFFTEEQLEKAIEIPFSGVKGMLDEFIYHKGLIENNGETIYVDGYFTTEEKEVIPYQFAPEELTAEYHLNEPDMPDVIICTAITGTKYSNNSKTIGNTYNIVTKTESGSAFFSHNQLCEVADKIGLPKPKSAIELSKKQYSYDVNLLNRKSSFTLDDAAKIAANIYETGYSAFLSQPKIPLQRHYIELLSDCIKGNNQDKFKLHTLELWCSSNDEFGERYSKTYDNGTYLKQRAVLDYDLTIISKQEFIRWCNYENIDTGLFYEVKSFDESIEVLKTKLNESEKEISRLRDLYINKQDKIKQVNITYPPELQLAIDAYEQLCLNKKELPTINAIKNWLKNNSKKRGITHKDGSTEFSGLSDVKLKAISSIIKS